MASPGGVAERSEFFNNNDCRWQSYPDLIAGRLDGSSEPARLTEEGWRQLRYCLHFVQWYQLRLSPFIFPCSDSFTTWRTAFIKQAPFSTHRTLHETFGARHPSSVTPLTGRASFPPGEAKGAGTNSPWCIPIGILRTANPSATLTRGPPPLSGEVRKKKTAAIRKESPQPDFCGDVGRPRPGAGAGSGFI